MKALSFLTVLTLSLPSFAFADRAFQFFCYSSEAGVGVYLNGRLDLKNRDQAEGGLYELGYFAGNGQNHHFSADIAAADPEVRIHTSSAGTDLTFDYSESGRVLRKVDIKIDSDLSRVRNASGVFGTANILTKGNRLYSSVVVCTFEPAS